MIKEKLLILIVIFSLISCVSKQKDNDLNECKFKMSYYQNNIPSDFSFTINYEGAHAYNFDSNTKNIEKLISIDRKQADTTIVLKENEKEIIWKKIKNTDVLKYPLNYESNVWGEITPSTSYNVKFHFNGTTKIINWTKNTESYSCREAKKLYELISIIDSIIINKPEYRHLPKETFAWE